MVVRTYGGFNAKNGLVLNDFKYFLTVSILLNRNKYGKYILRKLGSLPFQISVIRRSLEGGHISRIP